MVTRAPNFRTSIALDDGREYQIIEVDLDSAVSLFKPAMVCQCCAHLLRLDTQEAVFFEVEFYPTFFEQKFADTRNIEGLLLHAREQIWRYLLENQQRRGLSRCCSAVRLQCR